MLRSYSKINSLPLLRLKIGDIYKSPLVIVLVCCFLHVCDLFLFCMSNLCDFFPSVVIGMGSNLVLQTPKAATTNFP